MKKLTLVCLILFSLTGCQIKHKIRYPSGSDLYYTTFVSEEKVRDLGNKMEICGFFEGGTDYKVEGSTDISFSISTRIEPKIYKSINKYAFANALIALAHLFKKDEWTYMSITLEFISKKDGKTLGKISSDPRQFSGDFINRNKNT